MTEVFLCPTDEVAESGARGFDLGQDIRVFAVRADGAINVYHNRCPHLGLQLNWGPDRFLDRDRKHILCAAHGALFDIGSGLCIAGPCHGRSLTRMRHRLVDDALYVDLVCVP